MGETDALSMSELQANTDNDIKKRMQPNAYLFFYFFKWCNQL